jgi:hypothetical protein
MTFPQKMREFTYVSCWHMNDHESYAMWKLYLKSDAGIAVQTTFERLTDSIAGEKTQPVWIGKVRYVDYDADSIPNDHTLLPFMHKRDSFSHEQEVRAIMQAFGGIALQSIPIDLEVLVEKVFIAPTTPKWVRDVVQRVLDVFGLARKIQPSSLDQRPTFRI